MSYDAYLDRCHDEYYGQEDEYCDDCGHMECRCDDDCGDEDDFDAWLVELKAYITRYLTRNAPMGKEDPSYDIFYERMLDSHLQEYKRKMIGAQYE